MDAEMRLRVAREVRANPEEVDFLVSSFMSALSHYRKPTGANGLVCATPGPSFAYSPQLLWPIGSYC
jgi:hypothetical protein